MYSGKKRPFSERHMRSLRKKELDAICEQSQRNLIGEVQHGVSVSANKADICTHKRGQIDDSEENYEFNGMCNNKSDLTGNESIGKCTNLVDELDVLLDDEYAMFSSENL